MGLNTRMLRMRTALIQHCACALYALPEVMAQYPDVDTQYPDVAL